MEDMVEEAAQGLEGLATPDWEGMVMGAALGLRTLDLADMGGVEHQGLEVLAATLDLEDMAMLEHLVWPAVGQVSGATGRGVLQGWAGLEGGLDWGDMVLEGYQDLEDALVWVGLEMATVDHRLLWVESTEVGWEV